MFTFPVALMAGQITGGGILTKPTSRTGSALNGTNAYDGTGTPGTLTTSASLSSPASTTTRYEYYLFSGTTTYTKFKLYLTMDWTSGEEMSMFGDYVHGIIAIGYSVNGGSTYSEFEFVDTTTLSGSYSYTIPLDIGTLAAVALDSFRIRIRAKSGMAIIQELPDVYNYAAVSMTIKDVYIEASN